MAIGGCDKASLYERGLTCFKQLCGLARRRGRSFGNHLSFRLSEKP